MPAGDVEEAKADLSWGDVYETDKETAELAGEIVDEIGHRDRSSLGRTG